MKNMPPGSSKIVVLEIERVQLVRRKCRAHSGFCEKCERQSDFLSLIEAARLFDINSARLFRFIQANGSHYKFDAKGDIFLCVSSLFACVNAKTDGSKLKMITDGKAAETSGDIAAEFS
jgi:hypothetical protein